MALYGLPYFLEVLHSVATGALAGVSDSPSFDDVLASNASMLFPAVRPSGLNQTFYLQYLAAGGSSARNGSLEIDEAALLAVLEFYEQLLRQGGITADVLSYQSPSAYIDGFIQGADDAQIGVFWSSEFLAMRDQHLPDAAPGTIPAPRRREPGDARRLAVGNSHAGYDASDAFSAISGVDDRARVSRGLLKVAVSVACPIVYFARQLARNH